MQHRSAPLLAVVLALGVASPTFAQGKMNKVYKDESHCLTSADMRGERDNPISCFCRDAIPKSCQTRHYRYYSEPVLQRAMWP